MSADYAVDLFDRILGNLHGLPDVTTTRQSTVRSMQPLVGATETFIIQTYRQTDYGDTIFVEYIGRDRSLRLVFPPGVAEVIARQRDQLSSKNRRKSAKRVAEDRKAKGLEPGFMKGRVSSKAGGAR